MSIKVTSVSKIYGSQKALDTVSFDAKSGEIIGFLGPNGAGKSTMMKILTGHLKPNEGEVFVNEVDVLKNPLEAQQSIGYLPEQNPLYKDMYVREYLQFQASVYKVDKNEVETCIEKVGLTEEAHKKIYQLSKGYQQRVGLAAAILHNPTTGLDPNQLVEIRELIKELGKEKTVLLSTHIMQEVEAVCDKVIIIKKGKILLNKSINELQENQQTITVVFDTVVEESLLKTLPNLINFTKVSQKKYEFVFETEQDMRAIIFDFAQTHHVNDLWEDMDRLNSLYEELMWGHDDVLEFVPDYKNDRIIIKNKDFRKPV